MSLALHTRSHSLHQTFPSFAERLLQPGLLCGRGLRATCVCDAACFRWCFTLSGLTYLSGVKKAFPGNSHIPQTALECFYRRPRDLQRLVLFQATFILNRHCLMLFFFFILYKLWIYHCCFPHFIFYLLFLCFTGLRNVWLMAYKLERYTTNPLWFPAPPSSRSFISTFSNAVICQINWTIWAISYWRILTHRHYGMRAHTHTKLLF